MGKTIVKVLHAVDENVSFGDDCPAFPDLKIEIGGIHCAACLTECGSCGIILKAEEFQELEKRYMT